MSTAEGIKHQYRIKIDYSKYASPWRATLVMSSLPAYQLPRSMKGHGVTPLCSVESTLDRADMKLKNRHWYVPFFDTKRPGVLSLFPCFLLPKQSQVQLGSKVLPRRIRTESSRWACRPEIPDVGKERAVEQRS